MDISILTDHELTELVKEIEREQKKRVGDTKFLDSLTGYTFRAYRDDVYKKLSHLQSRCFDDGFLPVNDYCDEFDLPVTELTKKLEWSVGDRPFKPLLVPVSGDDDTAFMRIEFEYIPAPDFGY